MSEQEMQMKLALEQGKVEALRQEVAEMNKEREFWQQVRIQAAIAAMKAFIGVEQMPFEHIVGEAVKIADALVAELKHNDVYAKCHRMDAINTAAMLENMTKIQKEFQKKD